MEQLAFDGDSSGAVGLWDDDAEWRDAESTMDALRARFGPGSVSPASLLSTKKAPAPARRVSEHGAASDRRSASE
jgi:DNA polymerase-4